MSYRDEMHSGNDMHLNSSNSISMSYGAVRGSSHNLGDTRFDPTKASNSLQQLQSAATKQAIANAKQQTLLAQKLKQQMTNFASWATNSPGNTVDQNYGVFHSQWPVESTDYSNIYGLNNILLPGNQNSIAPSTTATTNAISNMLQPQTASLMNPTLAMVNPLINSLVNPLINPFTVGALGTFATGVPDGKQHALFVFHLPEDIDDHGLLQLFAPYGATRANVMRHDTGRSRGFGFVHFTNRQEAAIAIEMMNGHQIGRKRLRVSMKKEKLDGPPQSSSQSSMLQQQQDTKHSSSSPQ